MSEPRKIANPCFSGTAAADGTVSAALTEDTLVGIELRYEGDAGRNELRLRTWYDTAGRAG